MTTRKRISIMAALASVVLLAGCVEERYYGEVGWGGPVYYEPRYPDPYYGGAYPRYDRYRRYDRRYDPRYDRRYERPRHRDYAGRPDYPRPGRPDYQRPGRPDYQPSRPNPVVVQPQPPRVEPRPLPSGRICGGPADASGYCDPRGRGEGWGKTQ